MHVSTYTKTLSFFANPGEAYQATNKDTDNFVTDDQGKQLAS
jgi:hypothetical protein